MSAIDRDYWLDFAKDGVSKSIESREQAAEKLDTFLTWIWGIYTSVFALASLLNYMSTNICQLIFVAQPVLIIMISRYFCTLVSIPTTNNDEKMLADPNDVASIIDGFNLIVEHKKKKLQVAKTFTFISIISLCAALIGYNVYAPDKELNRDINTAKLKKELNDQSIKKNYIHQSINDSMRLMNEYYSLQMQNLINKRKLYCIENKDQKGLDSIKKFEK